MSCMCWLITAFQTQRLLAQHRAFGTPGRARGVDDQQRHGVVYAAIATIAAGGGDQRGQRLALLGGEIDADDLQLREAPRAAAPATGAKACSMRSTFTAASASM